MNQVLGSCPVCQSELAVTELHCEQCETTISGQFFLNPFSQLSAEQLAFIELFVRAEGKLNRVGQELELSYASVRARLTEVIDALGTVIEETEPPVLTEQEREGILMMVKAGDISAEEAMVLFNQHK